MSLPQNNLEDLKRRVPVGHITCHAMPLPDGGQPKSYKFKSAAGLIHPPPATLSTSIKTISVPNSNSPRKNLLAARTKPPLNLGKPSHSQSGHSNFKPSAKVYSPPLSKSVGNISAENVPASALGSPISSNVPSKRSTPTSDVMSSGGSYKRPKTVYSTKDIIKDENVMDAEWQDTSDKTSKHRATKVLPVIPQCLPPPPPPIRWNGTISLNLLAYYETYSLNDLHMMLSNNTTARLDAVDKLLRVVSGQETGLDYAMLQETSDNLDKRIAAIRAIIQDRQSGSSLTAISPIDTATTHNRVSPGIVTKTSSDLTSAIEEDDEDALWAQLDDVVPTNGLESVDSPLNNTPQPIGITLEQRQSPSTRQTYKTAESSSKDASRMDQTHTSFYVEIMQVLRNVFGLDSFRPNQLEAINATLSGKDVFVLMPTGGGKSLCYQVPAVCEGGSTKGVTVVVSPLIALMIDQVHHLKQRGIDVVLFNSDQGHESSRDARARLIGHDEKPKLLYVTPEKLHKSNDMRSILAKLHRDGELARFVIDEAHCVSTWGRDFRDAYQDLDRLRQEYPKTPIMALTATANEQVMNDVIDRLGITNCTLLTQSFNRPNLHYEVRPKKRNVVAEINTFIQTHHRGQTGIIYCLSRNKCEEVAKELREKHGLKAKHYHAQMSVEDKHRAQSAWQSGECDIIVATIAFGMGIDKAEVRYVIHHTLPMSLDGYYQETGRAGRDGKPATCVLYYTYGDTKVLFKLIQDGEKTLEEKKRQEDGVRAVVQYCQNEIDCRRVQVLGYFGQVFDRKDCHERCNNCLDNADSEELDMSDMAAQAIRLVKDLINRDKNVTKLHCLDVFRGANIKAIRDKGHDRAPLFGAGSHLTREQCERLFDHLLSSEGLCQVPVANRSGWNALYMQLGIAANDFLSGKRQLKMMTRKVSGSKSAAASKSKTTKTTRRTSGTVVSINRSKVDIFVEDDPDDVTVAELSRNSIDLDDIYDFGSSPPRPPATSFVQTRNCRKKALDNLTSLGKKYAHSFEDTDDVSQRCYKELLQLREEIARDADFNGSEYVIEESLLQIISAILPTDLASFKEVLNENLSKTQAGTLWKACGRRILEVCTRHKMATSEKTSSSKTKFDAMELHAQYDFHSSASGTCSHRTATKNKSGFSVSNRSTMGRNIRAMPL